LRDQRFVALHRGGNLSEIPYPVFHVVARSVGHAAATAHMADHCVGAALYAQRVLKLTKGSYEDEGRWQVKQLNGLPNDLLELVKVTLAVKAKGLGL